jgi:transposase-like protein
LKGLPCSIRIQDSVEAGTIIHTDRWLGYLPLESKGYEHGVMFLKGKKKPPSELMPRVHLVISLLKRWLMGTHQGAVSHKHLGYYLDEFTFRFNRRRSKSRGKLFFRLAQQAVAVDPVTNRGIDYCGNPIPAACSLASVACGNLTLDRFMYRVHWAPNQFA